MAADRTGNPHTKIEFRGSLAAQLEFERQRRRLGQRYARALRSHVGRAGHLLWTAIGEHEMSPACIAWRGEPGTPPQHWPRTRMW